MKKREWLKEKQLMIWAKYGYWVTQSSLDETYISDDEVILQQIEALKKLREDQPKLARDINSDLFELQTNPNTTTIKKYNEQYATNVRNDVEEEYVEILYWLSVFENSGLTQRQKRLLIDVCSGFSYEGNAKNFNFLIKKISKSKERVNKMNKRVFTSDELRKLFIGFYSKENTYWDEHLNYNKKLDIYKKSVEESKQTGDYYRQLSLQYSIFPYPFNEEYYKESH